MRSQFCQQINKVDKKVGLSKVPLQNLQVIDNWYWFYKLSFIEFKCFNLSPHRQIYLLLKFLEKLRLVKFQLK